MKRISASLVPTKLFGVVWWGVLATFAVRFFQSLGEPEAKLPAFWGLTRGQTAGAFLILFTTFAYFFWRWTVWSLANKVFDGGDFLIVRKGAREERIAITDIDSVTETEWARPPRVTLHLAAPCGFGSKIAFSPSGRASPIVEELNDRILQARRMNRAVGDER